MSTTSRLIVAMLLAISSAGCRGEVARETGPAANVRIDVPVDSETGEEPAFALWASPGNNITRVGEPRPGLVLAAWPDGRFVVGDDPLIGGAPYHEGRATPEQVARTRARLEEATAQTTRKSFAIPDSGCRQLFVSCAGPDRSLDSAIELFESNSLLVATDHGIEALDGRRREDVIERQSEEFRAFRAAWSRCIEALQDLESAPKSTSASDEPVRYIVRDP
jgi:hypothetical protein